MTIRPACENNGIVFIRTDITEGDNIIPALWNHVVDTQLCTVIGNQNGATIGTIEHLMSALRGCGIDNAVVELDGGEVPIMDGSADPFVRMIDQAGIMAQVMPRRAIKVLKEVTIKDGPKKARLSPAEGSVFAGAIDFNHPEIGTQCYQTELVNGNFRHDLAECRTFGFLKDVALMRKHGLALGGSMDNAIVLDKKSVLNPEGLRHDDEFIRHKILDAVGDLYLAGGQILGAYEANRPGHAINNDILKALFADQSNWEIVEIFGDETVPAYEASLAEPEKILATA